MVSKQLLKTTEKWDPYFMKWGLEADRFWKEYLREERNILFILGQGFDPRMCIGIQRILGAGGKGLRDCWLLTFNENPDASVSTFEGKVKVNREKLNELLVGKGEIVEKNIKMWEIDGLERRKVGSIKAAEVIPDLAVIQGYSDMILDISALPKAIYWPLIGKILYLLEGAVRESGERKLPNLHFIVTDNPLIDETIEDRELTNIDWVHGFEPTAPGGSPGSAPKIWLPILGPGKKIELERISEGISPDEVCPIIPSPALDSRKGDKLIGDYHDLLFNRWVVDPRNIIFAAEQNPFDVYRQITKTARYYNDSLGSLGRCIIMLSASSSKLLSIGAVLAAHELRGAGLDAGLALADPLEYGIKDDSLMIIDESKQTLFSLWLFGECYDE